jgi:antitoxin YefM
MQAIAYSQARNGLRDIINQVCDNFEQFIITTKTKQSAVLLSQEEYDSMVETMYLLSSKNNRDRLIDAVDEIDSLTFTKKDINV